MSPFVNMIDTLTTQFDEDIRPKISREQYQEFDRYYCMYALKWRYGQAFIEHFKLPNATPLYHFKDRTISREWILKNYVE